jgi:hypothetical protein
VAHLAATQRLLVGIFTSPACLRVEVAGIPGMPITQHPGLTSRYCLDRHQLPAAKDSRDLREPKNTLRLWEPLSYNEFSYVMP